jgi:hypothetical protein
MTAEYFDRDGKQIKQAAWVKLSASPDYRNVAKNMLGNNVRVCTIWSGVNFGVFDRFGRPMIFETTLFANGIILAREYIRLYPTKTEALTGHGEILVDARKLFEPLLTHEARH